MNIKKVNIDQINPAVYNPRVDLQPGDPEYEKLKRSIEDFGYIEPIVWNERTGNIVGGHQRFKILKERGDTEFHVSVVDLDDTREKALNIALNKISGDWDEEKLALLLEELKDDALALSLTGFESNEIDKIIKEFSEPLEDQAGDFENKELDIDDFDESRFDCKCPRCGFVFDSVNG